MIWIAYFYKEKSGSTGTGCASTDKMKFPPSSKDLWNWIEEVKKKHNYDNLAVTGYFPLAESDKID